MGWYTPGIPGPEGQGPEDQILELLGLYSKFNNDLGHTPPHPPKTEKLIFFSSKNLAKKKKRKSSKIQENKLKSKKKRNY